MIDFLMVPQPPFSKHLINCSKLHIAQGAFVDFHHHFSHLIRWSLTDLDVTTDTSTVWLTQIFSDGYIVCFIFAIESPFFVIIILLSDAREFFVVLPSISSWGQSCYRTQVNTSGPITVSCNLYLEFSRRFVDFLVCMVFTVIPGCRFSFLFSANLI